MRITGGNLIIQPDGAVVGALDLSPDKGELNAWYQRFEKVLPPALQGFTGVYLESDGLRVKVMRGGVPIDVNVTLRAESG